MSKSPKSMHINKADFLATIKDEYDGNTGLLCELIMGRHMHTGGFYSSQDLAIKAGITPNMNGIDLCCNNGESLRFLIRYRGVKHMTGVDISPVAIQRGRQLCLQQGFMDNSDDESRVRFIEDSVTEGLPMLNDESFDFVWGEDSWCHIPDKADLIKTAVRLLKPGGILSFTDWCLGPNHKNMTDTEYKRFLKAMTFPNLGSVKSYSEQMRDNGLDILYAHDTKRWLPCHQLYINMIEKQFKGDVLDIFNGDTNEYDQFLRDFYFMLDLAKQGKLCQGLFVGRKKGGKIKQSKL